jgi:RES domain
MASRSRRALSEPPDHLSAFPARTIRRTTRLYRAHTRGHAPWWFTSAGDGRFDLPAPDGTCYVADQPVAALRERLGPRVVHSGTVRRSELEKTVVSRLALPSPARVANAAHPDAYQHGCTTEIGTVEDYRLTNRWAIAFWRDGWMGVRYASRLSPGAVSVALFGTAGAVGWPEDADPLPAALCVVDLGLEIVDTPTPASLTFRHPPADAGR